MTSTALRGSLMEGADTQASAAPAALGDTIGRVARDAAAQTASRRDRRFDRPHRGLLEEAPGGAISFFASTTSGKIEERRVRSARLPLGSSVRRPFLNGSPRRE